VPQGQSQGRASGQDELYKFVVTTNEVVVPVRVTDASGARVDGLLSRDFSVYEDGKKQTMNFFTSDPVALSAAVIIDLGLPDVAVQRINQTFPALESAFSQYDEVSLYTYSSAVSRQTDFGAASRQLTATLNDLKTVRGRNNGPPVMSGPMGPQGPTVNNVPMDPNTPAVMTPPKESHVLNDAILRAALDLSKRDKTRRKIIFIVSDGREYRSTASYRDVLRVLLSSGIAVFGVAVEGSAIPGYNKLERLRLPGFGYSNILPKYSNATAGELFTDFSRTAIEASYARAMAEARNDYTLGYLTRATPSSSYRQIEVRVARSDVKVYARDGYYPVTPAVR
jgi:VWFA-related protein